MKTPLSIAHAWLFLLASGWISIFGAEDDLFDPPAKINRNEVVIIGQNFQLHSNETARSVVVIGGDAVIDGEVRDELVVIGGSAQINGLVRHQTVVVLGPARLGPHADIRGEVVVVGGPFHAHPDARMTRRHTEVTLGYTPNILWLRDWFTHGLLLGRPFPPGVYVAWVAAGFMLLLYLVTTLVFTRPIEACAKSLDTRPAGSILAGILGVVLFGPVCLLLLVSIVGIPAVPVLFCAMLVALFFGKIAICSFLGRRLLNQFTSGVGPHPALSVLIGGAILYVMYMVPILGFLLWALGTIWALGAVLVTFFGSFRRESPAPAPAPIIVNPVMATAAAGVAGQPIPPSAADPVKVPPPASAVAAPVYYQRAGFWLRLWASFLDWLLVGSVGIFIGHFILILAVAYFVGLWTWRGSTIGGIVLGLKVVRTDGQPINFPIALVRSLSSIFSALVLFLGFFWAGWDSQKQSWHDKIAGTVVVKVPRGVSLV